jgi:hypothetical protein
MPRVNFREALELFGHTDAEFIDFRFDTSDEEDYYRVRYCPWWLNPLYTDDPTMDAEASEQVVTLYPIGLVGFELHQYWGAYDWNIVDDHPLLYESEHKGPIIINQPSSIEEILDIVEDVQSRLTGYWKSIDLMRYVSLMHLRRWVQKSSYNLGHFPGPVLRVVLEVLNERHIETYPPYDQFSAEPMRDANREHPLICLLDGGYIIAKDFEIEANLTRQVL